MDRKKLHFLLLLAGFAVVFSSASLAQGVVNSVFDNNQNKL